MSPLEKPVPPSGEDIHLPPGSIQPLLLAFFVTVALVCITFYWPISVAAAVGAIAVIAAWIRDARRELEELPAHHEGH